MVANAVAAKKAGFVMVKSFGVMSIARIGAAVGAVFGFIEGLILTFVSFVAYMTPSNSTGSLLGGHPVIAFLGLFSVIIFPIIGALGGFVGVAIEALIYNFIAGKIGGVRVEAQEVEGEE